MARSSGGKSILERAVMILETFHTGVRDLSASEIADRSGMPMSTVHRILGELVDLGLLDKSANRRYRIGLHLWELAVRTPGALGVREIAMPFLRTAHSALGQHVQLGVLEGAEVLHLERLSAPASAVNFTVVGGRMPFHATSSGLVLAAFSGEEKREELATYQPQKFAFAPHHRPGEMRKVLDAVRKDGYAITRGYVDPAATAVAVPILNLVGTAVAAIAVVIPSDETHEAKALSVLLPTSRAIANALQRRYGTYSGDLHH